MSRMVLGRSVIAAVAASALGISVGCGTADEGGDSHPALQQTDPSPVGQAAKTFAASGALRDLGATDLSLQGDPKHGVVTILSRTDVLERVEFDEMEGGRSSLRADRAAHRYELTLAQTGVDLVVDGQDQAHATFDAAARKVVEDDASGELFASASDAIRMAAHAVEQVGGLADSPELTAAPRGNSRGPFDVTSGGACVVGGQQGQIVDGTPMNSTYWTPWTKATGCYYATQNLNNDCSNQYCFGCNTITGCDCSCVLGDTLCTFCTAYGNACDCYVQSGGGGGGGGGGFACQNDYEWQLCDDECFPSACDPSTCDCAD